MVAVTATGAPGQMIFNSGRSRASFDLHADADNTDTINIGHEPNVLELEELLPGQSITFEDFTGSIYAIAEHSGDLIYVVFPHYESYGVDKST